MSKSQEILPSSNRAAGQLLLLTSFLTVTGMANHPSSFSDFGERGSPLHGALIVVSMLVFVGLMQFSRKRNLQRIHILAALILLAFSCMANVLAGTLNGFVVPDLLAKGAAETAIMTLCWALNQALAYGAVYAAGGAFIILGVDMATTGANGDRLAGAIGALCGLVPVLLLATGIIDMHVGGAIIAYSVQAAFGLVAAWDLLRM